MTKEGTPKQASAQKQRRQAAALQEQSGQIPKAALTTLRKRELPVA